MMVRHIKGSVSTSASSCGCLPDVGGSRARAAAEAHQRTTCDRRHGGASARRIRGDERVADAMAHLHPWWTTSSIRCNRRERGRARLEKAIGLRRNNHGVLSGGAVARITGSAAQEP